MNTQRLTSIGASLAAVVFLCLWLNERAQEVPISDTHHSLKQLTLNVVEMRSAHGAEVKDLKDKLHQTTAQFNETSLDLREAQVRLAKLEFKRAPKETIPREEAVALTGITGLTNRFAKLIEPDGTLLLADAEMTSRRGEKLYFKANGKRKTLHVDEIHPLILQALDLDRDTIATEQRNLDEQTLAQRLARAARTKEAQAMYAAQAREKKAADAALEKERQRLQQEQEIQRNQMIIAQQELQEQQRRARASEQLRLVQLQNEQMRLQAEVEIARQNASASRARRNTPQLPTVPQP